MVEMVVALVSKQVTSPAPVLHPIAPRSIVVNKPSADARMVNALVKASPVRMSSWSWCDCWRSEERMRSSAESFSEAVTFSVWSSASVLS